MVKQSKEKLIDLIDDFTLMADRDGKEGVRRDLRRNLNWLGHVPLAKLTTADIRRRNRQLAKGRPWAKNTPLASNTVHNLTMQLKHCLAIAVDDHKLVKSPADAIKLKKPPSTMTW